jgi:hypothetical protein
MEIRGVEVTSTVRSIVPVEPDLYRDGENARTLRWLSREQAERFAADNFMEVIDFTEEIVDPRSEELSTGTDQSPAELLGRPLEDFTWVKYTVTMQPLPEVLEAFKETAREEAIMLEPDEDSRRCIESIFGDGDAKSV